MAEEVQRTSSINIQSLILCLALLYDVLQTLAASRGVRGKALILDLVEGLNAASAQCPSCYTAAGSRLAVWHLGCPAGLLLFLATFRVIPRYPVYK